MLRLFESGANLRTVFIWKLHATKNYFNSRIVIFRNKMTEFDYIGAVALIWVNTVFFI